MCGIYGWSWKKRPSFRQRDILARALGVMNDERGGHSWGWYRTDTFKLTKGLGEIKRVARCLAGANEVLAHTRFATTGEKTIRNAHPFDVGKIVGAHNGVFVNHSWVAHKYDIDKYEVDSEVLLHLIALGKPVDDLMGYGTVEYHKKGTPGIYLARLSSSADLAVADTKYGVVWSSKADHLLLALDMAGLYNSKIFDIKPGELVHAYHGKLYTVKDVTLKVDSSYSVTTSHRGWNGHYGGGGWSTDDEYFGMYGAAETKPTVRELFSGADATKTAVGDGAVDARGNTTADAAINPDEECEYCGVPLMEADIVASEGKVAAGEPMLCPDCSTFEGMISKELDE